MKCKYEGSDAWEGRCVGTKEVDPCIGYEKCSRFRGDYQSNADHIRSMTDEELAALLDAFCETAECRTADGAVCPIYSACPHDGNVGNIGTRGIWLDWLKQPYKEDAHAQT